MADGPMSPEFGMMGTTPEYVGAIFKQGRNARMGIIKPEMGILELDVTKKEDREAMIFQNLGTFGYSVSNPESVWKKAIDYYVGDLRQAALATGLVRSVTERPALMETEKEMMAMMAVTASARAMEKSGGSFEKYASYITQSAKPDFDKADAWREYLIHDDKSKLDKVKDHPFIRHYYDRLKEDVNKGRGSEFLKYLAVKNPDGTGADWRHRGMDDYISTYLLKVGGDGDSPEWIDDLGTKGIDDLGRSAAARLAVDVFLVDEYTLWEFKNDPDGNLKLRPSPDWGGDPLRAVIEPSFLPRRAKGMYRENPEILNTVDKAFRLDDIAETNETFRSKRLQPTMTSDLKKLSRYFDALNALLGDSRGSSIPSWGKDVLSKDLPTIVDKMDQVYGGIEDAAKRPVGKHLMGLIIARVIFLKASAAVLESAKPNLADRIAYLTEAKGGESFEDARAFLFGPKLDATEGFLYQCCAGRTRIVFRDNMFRRAEGGLGELVTGAKNMLEFNVPRDKVDKEKFFRTLKGINIILQGIGAEKMRR